MTEDEAPTIRFPGELFKVEFKPGDVFVLRLSSGTPTSVVRSIQDGWRATMPAEVKLLIVDNDTDLSLYRKVD